MTEAEAQSEQISKSARKRANKKAREAAEAAAESEPPAPAPKAAAKASSKAKAAPAPPPAEPEPKASAKAKPTAKAASKAGAKAKATAKAEPAPAPPAEPEPKAAAKAKPTAKPASKAKAKGAPKAEPTPPPPAEPEPKAAAKAKPTAKPASKAASKKAAAKPAPAPAPVPEEPKEEEKDPWLVEDDGTGGDWEVASAVPKKQQQRKQRKEDMKVAEKAVSQKRVPGATFVEQTIVKGPAVSQAVGNAVASVATKDAQEKAAPEPAAPSNRTVREIQVPEVKISLIIGPKGSMMQRIQGETETTLNVEAEQAPSAGGVKMRTVTVAGEKDQVARALGAIEDLVTKGYTALGVKGFEEAILWVHPSGFPDLIGSKGVVINAIKEKLKGVDISIPGDAPKDGGKSAKKYKVAIAGPTDLVKEAQEVVNSILMYHHHEITHPGEVHEELEIPDWAYGFVIGPKGSEMRHIQKNFNVRMYLPRDHSPNPNCVIVGDSKAAADRAKAYVEKIIWNAENQGNKRNQADNGDVWGEEEEEPWMAQYMYKRS